MRLIGETLKAEHPSVYKLAVEVKKGPNRLLIRNVFKLLARLRSGYGTCNRDNEALRVAREAFITKLREELSEEEYIIF